MPFCALLERPSANPYRKQLRQDRESLGVFGQASKGPEYPAHLQRDKQKFPPGTTNEERLRIESRDKINAAFVSFYLYTMPIHSTGTI